MPRPPTRRLREAFARRFGRAPAVVARAPGRVNLIGEHTDYNDGFVLPMALEQSTWVAAAPRADGLLHAAAPNMTGEDAWPMDQWSAQDHPHWTSYVAGVAALLCRRGARLPGCELLIESEVPVGGGLSSSAALEVALALALAQLAATPLAPPETADLCRAAEHEFAGVPCGIMDQYVVALAQADCAFLLDCRSRAWQHIPLPLGNCVVLVVNSGVRHKLVDGAYATRQEQCRQAVECFQRLDPNVRALRDVSTKDVRLHAAKMGPVIAARARHVTSENERTLAAAAALRGCDLAELGRLMSASHVSLRDDYEVSSPELDRLVEIVSAVPGVLGARMTGGGFGGCIVAIAQRGCIPAVEAALNEAYDATGNAAERILVSAPGPGAAIEIP